MSEYTVSLPSGMPVATAPQLVVPVSPGRYVLMALPENLTAAEWEQMHHVLDAARPGIVVGADTEPKAPEF